MSSYARIPPVCNEVEFPDFYLSMASTIFIFLIRKKELCTSESKNEKFSKGKLRKNECLDKWKFGTSIKPLNKTSEIHEIIKYRSNSLLSNCKRC